MSLRTIYICWQTSITIILLGLALRLYPSLAYADSMILDDQEIAALAAKYGNTAAQRLLDWRTLIINNLDKDLPEKLELVNRFLNRIEFIADSEHWHERDYWATPVEFLGTNGGDCEDFSIAKYFTLRELGVPMERMRLMYVKALSLNQAHMVLTYYETPDAEPLILDNLIQEIKPASQRTDLVPVYSFNGDNLWLSRELSGRGQLVGKSSRIGLWKKLIQRIKQQQPNYTEENQTGAQ